MYVTVAFNQGLFWCLRDLLVTYPTPALGVCSAGQLFARAQSVPDTSMCGCPVQAAAMNAVACVSCGG